MISPICVIRLLLLLQHFLNLSDTYTVYLTLKRRVLMTHFLDDVIVAALFEAGQSKVKMCGLCTP